MSEERSNEVWLADLQAQGPQRDAAIQDLLRWLERRVLYYLRGRSDLARLSDDELAQMAGDFAQESVLTILAHLDQFEGRSKFTTWAAKIGMNQALGELRRARWRDYSLDALDATDALESALIGDSPNTPEDQTIRRSVVDTVMDVLHNDLSDRQRTALYARLVLDMPIELLAEKMQTNVNALYKLIHDARKRLRRRLLERGLSAEEALAAFS